MDDSFEQLKKALDGAINSSKSVSRTPVVTVGSLNGNAGGSVTISLPPASVAGAKSYTIYRGGHPVASIGRQFKMGDRVILDPDNGAGPGTITGQDTRISTGKPVVYINHDNGVVSCVLEDDCKPYVYLNVGDKVMHAMMSLRGTIIARNRFNGKDLYGIQWDTGSTSEEELHNLVLMIQLQSDGNSWNVPPPPSCDCGAKAVGSDRHSNWCTLSDLTSLN